MGRLLLKKSICFRTSIFAVQLLALMLAGSAFAGNEKAEEAKKVCPVAAASFTEYQTCIRSFIPGPVGVAQAGAVTKTSYCQERSTLMPIFTYESCMGLPAAPTPGAVAEAPKKCDQICAAMDDPSLYKSNDPACDKDPACKACVIAAMSAQINAYCVGYKTSGKAIKGQKKSVAMYAIGATACGIGCAWPAAQPACQTAGVAIMVSDILGLGQSTEADKATQKWLDSVSNTALGLGNAALLTKAIAGKKAKDIATTVVKKELSGTAVACVGALVYGLQGKKKKNALKNFEESYKANCESVEKFRVQTTASPYVAACKVTKAPPPPGGPGPGLSVPTSIKHEPFNFEDPDTSALLGDTKPDTGLKDVLNSIKENPDFMNAMNDVGQKVYDGGDPMEGLNTLASLNSGGNLDGLHDIMKRVDNGETLTMLGDMDGSSTKYTMEGGEKPKTGGSAFPDEMRFGSRDSATPQDGAGSMEVGRGPASAGFGSNGDIWHSSGKESLFQIHERQLKKQYAKKNVQALLPESRMNRMLSGSAANHEAK